MMDAQPFLETVTRDLPLKAPFRISGHVFTTTPTLVATLRRGGFSGRGEASGVYYTGDTVEAARTTLAAIGPGLDPALTRDALRAILPPGGARNALDCALWELESHEAGQPVWKLAGIGAPRPLVTTVTLGADDPQAMARMAHGFGFAKALKLKLTGDCDEDMARVRAVRDVRPDVWIGVDANQGYAGADAIAPLISVLADCRVSLLEQPFRRGNEAALEGLRLPLPVAADESCLDLVELETLPGRFDVVNIKLDKCGGLTEGLMMAERARTLGLDVMVGNMLGSSLSTAPGFVLGQLCNVVDLDGPLFLAEDPAPTVSYVGGTIWCGEDVWGAPSLEPAEPR
jgi:L-alanine-DL-glutamate epimerase-like enolase superfamily enzyme